MVTLIMLDNSYYTVYAVLLLQPCKNKFIVF